MNVHCMKLGGGASPQEALSMAEFPCAFLILWPRRFFHVDRSSGVGVRKTSLCDVGMPVQGLVGQVRTTSSVAVNNKREMLINIFIHHEIAA